MNDRRIKIGGIIVGVVAFGFILFGCLPTRYSCTDDIYNCNDFDSIDQAQEVLDYCTRSTGLDIHHLDSDNNNIACD